jgi:hypothetical protein
MEANDSCAPPDDRKVKLAAARQLNFALSALAVVAALSFWLGGASLHLPAAIVLALLSAALVYLAQSKPQLYALGKPKKDPRTDLSFALYACGFGLILGNREVYFVETTMLFECAALIGLLCCAAILVAARKNPKFWSKMFGTLLIAGIFGWGLAATADSAADSSAPARYTATVANKYESYLPGNTYHLALAPWGPIQKEDSLTVSKQTYISTAIGAHVCLELYSGALYASWYRIVPCDDTSQR